MVDGNRGDEWHEPTLAERVIHSNGNVEQKIPTEYLPEDET